MPRAAVPKSQRARNAGISLPPALIRRASRLATARGISLSGLAKTLLLQALDQEAAAPAANSTPLAN